MLLSFLDLAMELLVTIGNYNSPDNVGLKYK